MCECNKTINEKLASKNLNTVIYEPLTLSDDLTLGSKRVNIETIKANKNLRKKPTKVFASFCPFCGERYAS